MPMLGSSPYCVEPGGCQYKTLRKVVTVTCRFGVRSIGLFVYSINFGSVCVCDEHVALTPFISPVACLRGCVYNR